MQCPPNCGKCCGLIPLPKETFDKNKDRIQTKIIKLNELHLNKVLAVTEDLQCVFLNRKNKKCVIYPDRPEICKNYGLPDCSEWKDYPKKP
tara:strand:- start:221 stop:493 length:273 start_codon:yes stop_codon:yes gene_type:complete